MAGVTAPVQERVVQFGPSRGLVGVLAVPEKPADVPHVILLSTGVIHRVGSSRLYVELSRALAAAGVHALRFDLSGVGDSDRRQDVQSVRESVERDISDAIAYVATAHGAKRVVLMGLCSGAFDAFHAATIDDRIAGAIMVDMPGPFRGLAHTARHIGARLLKPSSWRNPVRSLLGHSLAVLGGGRTKRTSGGERFFVGARSTLTRELMAERLDALLARGMRLHFSFTMGLEANYNHASQFKSTFPRAARHPLLSWDFYPEPDHSFGTRAMRERLIGTVVPWVRSMKSA